MGYNRKRSHRSRSTALTVQHATAMARLTYLEAVTAEMMYHARTAQSAEGVRHYVQKAREWNHSARVCMHRVLVPLSKRVIAESYLPRAQRTLHI
jgi:hypothetical protein